jgi:galactonate dehydratase
MDIADISVFPLREPASGLAYTVVRLKAAGGLVGFGECARISPAELKKAQSVVLGKPATTWEVIRRELVGFPAIQAAVNMALLDIVGKAAKVPVYQLLGGPTRNKARAMAMLEGSSDDALQRSLERVRKTGVRAAVVPTPEPTARNQGQAFVQSARRRLETLRAVAGKDFDFVLDGGGALTPGDASSVAAEFERFHLLWFDEPCAVSNLRAIQKMASETVTPIGMGRTIHSAGAFQDLLREDAVDVLRPDIALNGIAQIRKMAALAETYYVAVAPRHTGGPVATAAALQLAASLPNFFIQEIPLPSADEDQRMRADLAGSSLEKIQDGFARLPLGPGLGITVNEAALEKYKERA